MAQAGLLDHFSRDIINKIFIGSEKTTRSTAAMPRSPEPEATGLQAEPHCSQHTGGPN
jgi:hypothetical protein